MDKNSFFNYDPFLDNDIIVNPSDNQPLNINDTCLNNNTFLNTCLEGILKPE